MWLERTKWPDLPHYGIEGIELGEDSHGRWVGIPPEHPVFRGDEQLSVARHRAVVCVPHDDWYMAYWPIDHPVSLYVDIVTPPTWTARGATMVDLDFDVIVRNGEVLLVDEDEFEEHRVRYGYPDDLTASARRATADILDRIQRREPPFGSDPPVGWQLRLAEVLDGDL